MTIIQDSLTVTPSSSATEAVLKIHSSSGTQVLNVLTVAVRDSHGNNLDYPDVANVSVGTSVYTYDKTKILAPGVYTVYGAYEIGSTWTNLPSQQVTVPSGNVVTVTSPDNQTGTVGTPVSLQMAASDTQSGQTLTWIASGLPGGLMISSSGLISGTPGTASVYNPVITATDTTGAYGTTSFTWTENAAGGPGTRLGKANVFWDDFTADLSKWKVNSTSSYPGNGPDNPGDHKQDYFHAGNVALAGGSAVFTAADAGFQIGPFPPNNTDKEAWYTAFLTTEGVTSGFKVQTGDYLEGKFLLPGSAGAWPALWTWRSGGNEVDVFEYHPDNPNLLEFSNHISGQYEYYTNAATVSPGTWVTIGTLIGATSCQWYVNGVNVYSDTTGVGSSFNSYINLNLSLSDGYYHPAPSGSQFTFSTDYVGVWRG